MIEGLPWWDWIIFAGAVGVVAYIVWPRKNEQNNNHTDD